MAVVLLALAGGGLVWHAASADATAGAVAAEDPTTTTSSPSTTVSTTSTSTTSSTSTTVKPKPVATPAPVPTTIARRPPVTAPPAVAPATTPPPVASRPAGASAEERCAAALQWVAQHGLTLPAGWGFRCPGQALENGTPRWGIACWNCEGNGSWVAVDVGRIGSSDATLRYVIAHEICPAVDYMTTGLSSELGADLCAALHGAGRP